MLVYCGRRNLVRPMQRVEHSENITHALNSNAQLKVTVGHVPTQDLQVSP